MKKLYILTIIAILNYIPAFADDEWGIEWAYDNHTNKETYYYSYYPGDTKSSDAGYYIVSGYQNVSVYEPLFIHISSKPPRHRDYPKPTPKPEPKPEHKPTPKPDTRKPKPTPTPPTPTPKKKKEKCVEVKETQEHREKRMEDEYYKTHNQFFPKHAVFDEVLGKRICSRGYIPDNKHLLCVEVTVPENAQYSASSERGWTCKWGYMLNSQANGCLEIVVPKHASLNETGNGWKCDKWYIKTSDSEACVAAKFPPHATKNIFSPIGWSCDFGYNMQEDYSCKK